MNAPVNPSLYKDHLDTAVAAARAAGAIQREHYQKIEEIHYKGEVNLVTHVDISSEKKIKEIIRQKFPDHEILAEESDLERREGSPFRWIVDPLDGTTNYAHGYPLFGPSIALVHEGGPVVGVVYNPFWDELFTAVKGGGAFLNGKPISVSKIKAAKESLFCTGFPYDRKSRPDHYLAIFKEFMLLGHCVRRGGSAATDLCYLAAGRFEGFWEEKLKAWDVAAAVCILKEAGGAATNFDGSPVDIYAENICASNGKIHAEMLGTLKPFLKTI